MSLARSPAMRPPAKSAAAAARPSPRRARATCFKALADKLGVDKPSWLPAFNKQKRRAEVDAKVRAGWMGETCA